MAKYRVTARVASTDEEIATATQSPELAALIGRVVVGSNGMRISFDVQALTAIAAEQVVVDALQNALGRRVELELSVPL